MKRRVKTNIWGNTNGYEGNRKVKEFDLRATDKEIEEWLEGSNQSPETDDSHANPSNRSNSRRGVIDNVYRPKTNRRNLH